MSAPQVLFSQEVFDNLPAIEKSFVTQMFGDRIMIEFLLAQRTWAAKLKLDFNADANRPAAELLAELRQLGLVERFYTDLVAFAGDCQKSLAEARGNL